MSIEIRRATKEDVPGMMRLVKELAIFEKAEHEVVNTEEAMLEDGFSENSIFGAFVAILDGEMVGTSIYYYRYSTWKGKRMYLEDLVVTEKMRGKGMGKQLFEAVIQEGKDTKCTGMMWQVLDWNESAIEFYKKYGTAFDEEWVNCNIEF